MKLYYYRGNNFGDKLNPVIWDALIPELVDEDDSTLLVGMGTLINSRVPSEPRKLVFGSGVGYNKAAHVDDKWKFYCVRGPLTAAALGLDKNVAITDPALLLTRIVNQPVAPTGEVVFMPHHSSMLNADWAPFCAKAGITFLDPEADMHEVLTRIRGAKLVIAEAMHAAIVADAYRVPWIPVQCYEHILGFKWEDWCQSMSVPYRPQSLPSVWDIDKTLGPRDRLAANVKRGLRGVGIWKGDWTPPPPAKNVRQVEDAVVGALSRLASSGESYLTDERLQSVALERLLGQIDQLKRDYAVVAA